MNNLCSIVQFNTGTFYKMRKSDSRFNVNYNEVSEIVHTEGATISQFNKYKCNIVTTADGNRYEVFYDWSARLV